MKLISMTDFVLRQNYIWQIQTRKEGDLDYIMSTNRYAQFLKQQRTLGMFVPCDEEGDLLTQPVEPVHLYNDKECDIYAQYQIYLDRYNKAKERVLFEGFEYNSNGYVILKSLKFDEESMANLSIESLVNENLTLTQSAIKQLGL